MDTSAFLKKILPDTGIYFLATPNVAPRTGFKHHTYHSLAEMAQGVQILDAGGATVYHACATFKHSYIEVPQNDGTVKKKQRVHENVHQIKAFWYDIDCGEGKPYADQVEGFNALKKFLKETHLPKPSLVVLSGNGLHVYWTLTDPVIPSYWRPTAQLLKKVAFLYGLKTDDSRTADHSSVLRPAGSTHRKGAPKKVTVHLENPDVVFSAFHDALMAAATAKGYKEDKPAAPINSEYYNKADYSTDPVFADLIANNCQQVAMMRDTQGNIPEPHWYDVIGVLRFCQNGAEIIQEWSEGHPTYDFDATARKIAQHKDGDYGPTTCAKFDSDNPGVCQNCPKYNKITSPIVLGRDNVVKAPVEVVTDDAEVYVLIPPPRPYVRLKDGSIGIDMGEGEIVPFMPYDIVPIKRIYDVDAKQAVVRFRVTIPGDSPREFETAASSVSGRELAGILSSKEIYLNDKAMKMAQSYLMSYLVETQKISASEKMYSQMGWKDDFTKFVVGATTYNADGTVEKTKGIRDRGVTDWFAQKGSLDEWVEVAKAYSLPGHEAYQFGLLTGFAAPLMSLTEYKGTVISMVSPRGGQGKTTIQEGAASIWGHPKKSMLQANDKILAVFQRLGKYCNLPACMDELTNMETLDLSYFVFQLSQGRERIRLNANSTEKESDSFWATLLLSSSNASLIHKVGGIRANSEAEALRIFEFSVINPGIINKQDADTLFHKWQDNYGVAGDVFARYMVTHVDEVREMIKAVRAKVDKITNAAPNERFWSNAIVLHMVAGSITNSLGLTNYDMKALLQWAVNRMRDMRGDVADNITSNLSLVTKFLLDNIGKRLVANHGGTNGKVPTIMYAPQQSLMYRIETDQSLVIIPQQTLKIFLSANNGDYNEFKRELKEMGALVDTSSKRKLGAGSNIESLRTECIVFSYEKAGIGLQLHSDPLPESNVRPIGRKL